MKISASATDGAHSGFTLVSLAIVLLIIGFLVALVINGHQMLRDSRLQATVSQFQAYKAATHMFRDRFRAWPGDMEDALTRLPQCDAASFCQNGNGDRIIGFPFSGNAQYPYAGTLPSVTVTGAGQEVESRQYWLHLYLANYISSDVSSSGQIGWGRSQPYARVGGGFELFFNNLNPTPGGHWLILRKDISTQNPLENIASIGTRPLSEEQAALMDKALDDGLPASGMFQAGPAPLCTNSTVYNAQSGTDNCNVFYNIDRP